MIHLLKCIKNLTIFEFIIQLNYIIYINKTNNNKQIKIKHYGIYLFNQPRGKCYKEQQ